MENFNYYGGTMTEYYHSHREIYNLAMRKLEKLAEQGDMKSMKLVLSIKEELGLI